MSDAGLREPPLTRPGGGSAAVAPLFLAGFTTAFGAHSVAAVAGVSAGRGPLSGLLGLAALLAVYDLAEVLLKPVFGVLSDRVGPKPVILGGLAAFAAVSLVGALLPTTVVLILVRFGQGAAASAFSPASSASVARLTDPARLAGAFGRYGSWKGIGYALGPVLGAGVVGFGGWSLLGVVLAAVAAVAGLWVAVRVPSLPPVSRPRATLAELVRLSPSGAFFRPTLLLAVTAGTVAAAVGFLPALGAGLGMNGIAATAAATALAVTSALVQPMAGRAVDAGRLRPRRAIAVGVLLVVGGLLTVSFLPAVATIYLAAAAAGIGVGVITPVAFAALAAGTPVHRLGRTMGAAEMGREVGDAGAPAFVGVVAVGLGLQTGLALFAAVVLVAGVLALGAAPLGRGNADRWAGRGSEAA